MRPTPTSRTLRSLLSTGRLELAHPGDGSTPTRLHALSDLARTQPIGVARLAEAHTDAIAILHEADRAPARGALYGVWASQTAANAVTYDPVAGELNGTMGFASGLEIVDRALVTARKPDGSVLVDVDVAGHDVASLRFGTDSWTSPALVDTATGPITFVEHPVSSADVVERPGWYLGRVGFWHGACGPAACWAGGARGLIDVAAEFVDDDPHRRAHHGALLAHSWTLSAVLCAAGRQIDAEPHSAIDAEMVARSMRFTIAGICRDVMDRFGRAFGPRPYVEHGSVAQRVIDLDLYIKQHHGERELPHISTLHACDR